MRAESELMFPCHELKQASRCGALLVRLILTLALGAICASPVFAQGRGGDPADAPSDGVNLDFNDVELTVVIDTIAKVTGKNFIYDDRVRGRVTILSPEKVSVPWADSWDAAVKEASARNLPIFISFHQDG